MTAGPDFISLKMAAGKIGIDDFKYRVGVKVEWNSKTDCDDRDLNNFRLLRGLRVLSVGVIITRLTELQTIFD
jgi:Restriction endonuclease BglII